MRPLNINLEVLPAGRKEAGMGGESRFVYVYLVL